MLKKTAASSTAFHPSHRRAGPPGAWLPSASWPPLGGGAPNDRPGATPNDRPGAAPNDNLGRPQTTDLGRPQTTDLGRPQTTSLGPEPLRSPPPGRVTHVRSANNSANN